MEIRKSGLCVAAGLGLVACVLMSTTGGVAAQEDGSGRRCSAATLRGSYGFLLSGVRAVPSALGGGTEAVIATGVRHYDGNGGFKDAGSGLHGQITGLTPDLGGVTGTYVVNADCTGTSRVFIPGLPFAIEHTLVIVDNGRQVKEAVMFPVPNVVSVVLDRQ